MHTCVLAVKDTSVVVIFFVSVNFYFSIVFWYGNNC